MALRCPAAALCAAALIAGGCTTPPPAAPPPPQSYVVLLPNADGTSGAVTVQGAKGEVVLDRPGHGVNLDGAAAEPYAVEEVRIQRDFSAAMAAQPAPPVSFVLHYELGTTQLMIDSKAVIPRLLEAVRSRPAAEISVIGHTDTVGADDWNEKLGMERAQSVAEMIQKAGLTAQSVTVASHGERNLLVPTPDNTPESRNRRVEITVR